MNVTAYGRTDKKNVNFNKFVSGKEGLIEIAQKSDFIIIAIPYHNETYKMINEEFFQHTNVNSVFINIARGVIVDENALIGALRSNQIKAAALDVFETEPLTQNSELWQMDQVFITTHKSGCGDSWVNKLAELFRYNLEAYRNGKTLKNCINMNKK